jgi:hypothetical protein
MKQIPLRRQATTPQAMSSAKYASLERPQHRAGRARSFKIWKPDLGSLLDAVPGSLYLSLGCQASGGNACAVSFHLQLHGFDKDERVNEWQIRTPWARVDDPEAVTAQAKENLQRYHRLKADLEKLGRPIQPGTVHDQPVVGEWERETG